MTFDIKKFLIEQRQLRERPEKWTKGVLVIDNWKSRRQIRTQIKTVIPKIFQDLGFHAKFLGRAHNGDIGFEIGYPEDQMMAFLKRLTAAGLVLNTYKSQLKKGSMNAPQNKGD